MSRGGEQSGEQGDNQNAMSMAMFMQLQREFETLKKSNEEELSMLRAENVYMKRKLNEETILNTSLETVQPRTPIHQRVHNEQSFEVTRKKIQRLLVSLSEYLLGGIHFSKPL